MKPNARSVALLWSAAIVLGAWAPARAAEYLPPRTEIVTNVAQFSTLTSADYVSGCDFRLTGVVTLVDSNRNLVVLQDDTGAVALNFPFRGEGLNVGRLVTLEGSNCTPYFPSFPDYPYRPSGWDVQRSFEAPANWGEYHLTRMRGYLHPPTTGEYSFWIASDNSSELWLSVNADASKARKIASVQRFGWVARREWARYSAQRSEPVLLKAGETYYIEALCEQTSGEDHLAVAWQGPGLRQSIIGSPHLTPWGSTGDLTNGILREYWTNYSTGDLEGLAGARGFESALAVERVRVNFSGPGELPKPDVLTLDQQLAAQKNFRWVQTEGLVKFVGSDEGVTFFELSDGHALVQVRLLQCSPEMAKRLRNVTVRIEGVCEGVPAQSGSRRTFTPSLIWASGENKISFIETATNIAVIAAIDSAAQSIAATNPAMQGFYGMRGVVTFNDRVFDNDYIFVQEAATVVMVAHRDRALKNQLNVGKWVDLGGALQAGRHVPVISPLVAKELGWRAMPLPLAQPLAALGLANREGRWSELEGVVHSVNTNGTLSVVGKDGHAFLWLGQTPSNNLASYVDTRLRARGVLMLNLLSGPVLLVPNRNFLDVEESMPGDPFNAPKRSIADVFAEGVDPSYSHRERVIGEVTYHDARSFFVQDASGGVRVRTSDPSTVQIGETIEVLGFPAVNGFVRTLTEALVRPATVVEHIKSKSLDLSQALSSDQSGSLVHISATLVARKTNALNQVLELQDQQRTFLATLPAGKGSLPEMLPGSRLRITGVCDDETTAASPAGDPPAKAQLAASLNILLRRPQDVAVLSGPPWWSLKRTVTLVAALMTVILGSLLWVHLLQRRLERQRAAQLAFARQMLERLEDERRRIAANLHDGLGQVLLAIKNTALLAIQRPPDEQGMNKHLNHISGASSQAIEEVRQITHGLRPYQLDRLGLTQAIRASVNWAAENSSISFAALVEDIDGLFDKDAEIHVYRVVQEAVTNVVKHSSATEAAVVIKQRTATVTLSIRDNGRGFDPAKRFSQPHDLGYGLSGIDERVRILGATLVIDSQPNEGTNLTVDIPVPNRRHATGSNSTNRG